MWTAVPPSCFLLTTWFRGLILQPGDHTIEYRYMPGSFVLGFSITLVACVTSSAAALWVLHRPRTAA